jgi:hypothetical protein
MKFDINKFLIKITSRKFVLALVGVIVGVYLIYKGNGTAETISGVISTVISIISYLISETAIDISTSNTLDTSAVENITNGIMTIIDNIKGLFVSKVDNVEETNK